jgi:acid phosphatase
MPVRAALLLAAFATAHLACAPTDIAVPDTTEVPVGPVVVDVDANENLHAVLWTQTAVEFRALALQTYDAARDALADALADPGWTAMPEQLAMGNYETLPPAVVLDVDETVLDNAVYQARMIEDGTLFSRETWSAWVEEAAAPPVPGVLAFTQAAADLGITVVYLTNRRGSGEAATRRNLEALGFPIDASFDAVLTRGDLTRNGEPEFDTGEKGPRREHVAERFRVLQLFGDNLGDFLSDVETSPAERDAIAEPYADWWGSRWFMLPNPQYGSWEGALFEYDYSLTREERLQRKADALETGRD